MHSAWPPRYCFQLHKFNCFSFLEIEFEHTSEMLNFDTFLTQLQFKRLNIKRIGYTIFAYFRYCEWIELYVVSKQYSFRIHWKRKKMLTCGKNLRGAVPVKKGKRYCQTFIRTSVNWLSQLTGKRIYLLVNCPLPSERTNAIGISRRNLHGNN